MADYLTPQQYEVLINEINEGEARLAVSRNLARQFFFNVGNRNIRDLTGVSMIGRKSVVVTLLVLSLTLALLCLVLVIREFGQWAMIGVPLVGIFWTVFAGFTTEMGSYLSSTTLMLACGIAAWFLPYEYGVTLFTFGLSMYAYRLAHLIAETFLLQLLHSSYDAYDMLYDHLELDKADVEHHAG